MSELAQVRKQVPENRLVLIGLLKSDRISKARQIMRRKGVTWPQIPVTRALEKAFGVTVYP
ncbi:MAG: hypothetical protein D6681_20420, partial [Calditrichaeota bacterium]